MGHVRLARNTATVLKHLEETLALSSKSTSAEILDALKLAAKALEMEHRNKYWTTDAGREEYLRRYEAASKPSSANSAAKACLSFTTPRIASPCSAPQPSQVGKTEMSG